MRFTTQEWFCFYMYNSNTDPFLKAKPKALYCLLGGKASFKGWVLAFFFFIKSNLLRQKDRHIIKIKQIY